MKYSILSVLVGSLILVGCGGREDKKNTQSDTPKPVQSNLNTSTTKATFSNTVSSQTTVKIKEIVSPVGTSLATSNSAITTQQETLVTALDDQGEIRLAGITTASQPLILDAESTAIALVRLAMQISKNVKMDDVNKKITASNEFSKLKSLIQNSLDKGELATNSEDVLLSILNVTQQVASALNTSVAAEKSLVQARALPVEPAIKAPFPFYLVNNLTSSITINSSNQLTNNMPIAWSARSTTYLGKPIISTDSDAKGNIAIPPADFLNRTGNAVKDITVFGALANFFLANNVTIPSDNGNSFELTLEQTEQTHRANIHDVFNSLMFAALDISGTKSTACMVAIAKTVIQDDKLKNFAVSNNSDDAIEWLNDASSSNLTSYLQNSKTVADGCTNKVDLKSMLKIAKGNFSYQYKLFKTATKAFNQLNPIFKGAEYASIAEKSWFIRKYWNGDENGKPIVLTACMGKNGKISNCAVKFKLEPEGTIIATAGAEIPITLKAYDKNDKETLLPNSLKFQTDDIKKSSINADNTKLTALKQGTVQLRALDPTTDKKSDFPIEIVYPRFKESEITIKEGEEITLPLVDQKGRAVQYNGLTEWSSGDETVAKVFTFIWDPKKYAGTQIVIKGLKEGETNIAGTNLADGSLIGVKVKVEKISMLEILKNISVKKISTGSSVQYYDENKVWRNISDVGVCFTDKDLEMIYINPYIDSLYIDHSSNFVTIPSENIINKRIAFSKWNFNEKEQIVKRTREWKKEWGDNIDGSELSIGRYDPNTGYFEIEDVQSTPQEAIFKYGGDIKVAVQYSMQKKGLHGYFDSKTKIFRDVEGVDRVISKMVSYEDYYNYRIINPQSYEVCEISYKVDIVRDFISE